METIPSPPLPSLATPHLFTGQRSRALLRHLRVKCRKEWQANGVWFDAEEEFPIAPPPAPADQRLADLGMLCIYPCVGLYVEIVA